VAPRQTPITSIRTDIDGELSVDGGPISFLHAADGNAPRLDQEDDGAVSERTGTATGRRRRGRPAKLSRPAIFAAAVALIDRDGPSALTMRAVAGELGVEAMSLYRHVDGKDALLDGVAEQLMSEIEPRGSSAEWAVAVRGFASSVRGVSRNHPQAFALVAMRALDSTSALQPVEDLLASLRGAGFTPARAVAAYRVVAAYTRGYVLSEIAGFALSEDVVATQLRGGRFPAIRGLSRQLAHEPTNAGFRSGLETIINGLRVERES
jgi:AcrR family transcriptional regulator